MLAYFASQDKLIEESGLAIKKKKISAGTLIHSHKHNAFDIPHL